MRCQQVRVITSGEYHPVGLDAEQLCFLQIGEHDHLLADERVEVVELFDARDDLAGLGADVDLQLCQFVCALDALGGFDAADADVDALEGVEVDAVLGQRFDVHVGVALTHVGFLRIGFLILSLVLVRTARRGRNLRRERLVEFLDALVGDLLEQFVGLVERARLGVDRVGIGGVNVHVDIQLGPERLGLPGTDGFEEEADRRPDLQAVTDDGRLLLAAVVELPRFVLLDVLVAELREFHRGVARVAHVVVLHCFVERLDGLVDAVSDIVAHRRVGGAVEVPSGKEHRAVDEVPDRPNEFAVDSLLEALPGEVQILLEPTHRGEVVAQEIRVEPFVEILLGPDRAVPAGREPLAVDGDEARRTDRTRLGVARGVQHRWPEDGVVLDDVPADDVDDFATIAAVTTVGLVRRGPTRSARGTTPHFLPVVLVGADTLRVLLGGGDVLNGGVDPDVEHELLFAGVVDTPVHVPRDTPVLQPLFNPLAGLVLGVRGALNPVEEPREVVRQLGDGEVFVLTLAVLGGVARQRRDGVFDLAGFEVATTALITLVTAGLFAAVRAGALDVAIRQRLVLLGVPRDEDFVLVDVTLGLEALDELPGEFSVRLVVGVAVVVELDVELRERLLVLLVIRHRQFFGADALFGGVDRNRRTVHVRATDVRRLLA